MVKAALGATGQWPVDVREKGDADGKNLLQNHALRRCIATATATILILFFIRNE